MNLKCYLCKKELKDEKIDIKSKNALNNYLKKNKKALIKELEPNSEDHSLEINKKEVKEIKELYLNDQDQDIILNEYVIKEFERKKENNQIYFDLFKKIESLEKDIKDLSTILEDFEIMIAFQKEMENNIKKPLEEVFNEFIIVLFKELENLEMIDDNSSNLSEMIKKKIKEIIISKSPIIDKMKVLKDLISRNYIDFFLNNKSVFQKKHKSLKEYTSLVMEIKCLKNKEEELKQREEDLIKALERLRKENDKLDMRINELLT